MTANAVTVLLMRSRDWPRPRAKLTRARIDHGTVCGHRVAAEEHVCGGACDDGPTCGPLDLRTCDGYYIPRLIG